MTHNRHIWTHIWTQNYDLAATLLYSTGKLPVAIIRIHFGTAAQPGLSVVPNGSSPARIANPPAGPRQEFDHRPASHCNAWAAALC